MFRTKEEAMAYMEDEGVRIVDFKLTDREGRWHHLSITAERFNEDLFKKGIGFDASSYGFVSVENSDMVFYPDVTTAFRDPFAELPTLVMLVEIYTVGDHAQRYESDPRYIAQKAEEQLREKSIADEVLLGPEFEFYVLDGMSASTSDRDMHVTISSRQAHWEREGAPETAVYAVPSHGGYHLDRPFDSSADFRDEACALLEAMGVPIKYHHSENGGPGQVEIEVNFAGPLTMGDRTMMIKWLLRRLAKKRGRVITFMPKPFAYECGNGFHIHFLMNKGGQPLFYEKGGYADLSTVALHAIGGILTHAPAIMPFSNASSNSFKRLVPGYEAPVSLTYGKANRSAVIRIPGYAVWPDEKRFEVRFPDLMGNPYLMYAAFVLAMIDGIERKIDPEKGGFGPYDVNLYTLSPEEQKRVKSLPTSMKACLEAMEKDRDFLIAGGVFPSELLHHHQAALEKETAAIERLPHPEEFVRYFNR